MKHAHVTTNANVNVRRWLSCPSLLLGIVIALTACQKQPLVPPPPASEAPVMSAMQSLAAPYDSVFVRIAISKNGVLERKYVQNNLKQMTLSAVYNADGSIREEMTYDYDALGRLTTARIKNGGTYLYAHDANGRIASYKFYETGNTNTQPVRSGPYRWDSVALLTSAHHYNRKGQLERTTTYRYDSYGQCTSVVEHSYINGMVLKKEIKLTHQANPDQIAAWKEIAALFPQPELPWDILSLLSIRIEERTSTGDDVWVEGTIITAENMSFNHDALLVGKTLVYPPNSTTNGRPHEMMSLNYTKVVW